MRVKPIRVFLYTSISISLDQNINFISTRIYCTKTDDKSLVLYRNYSTIKTG